MENKKKIKSQKYNEDLYILVHFITKLRVGCLEVENYNYSRFGIVLLHHQLSLHRDSPGQVWMGLKSLTMNIKWQAKIEFVLFTNVPYLEMQFCSIKLNHPKMNKRLFLFNTLGRFWKLCWV